MCLHPCPAQSGHERSHLNFTGARKESISLSAHALHHVFRNLPLKQFDQRGNGAKAVLADRFPARLWNGVDIDPNSVESPTHSPSPGLHRARSADRRLSHCKHRFGRAAGDCRSRNSVRDFHTRPSRRFERSNGPQRPPARSCGPSFSTFPVPALRSPGVWRLDRRRDESHRSRRSPFRHRGVEIERDKPQ